MQKRKNIYTMNRRDPDAIVYLDGSGNVIRLTREVFASEEEFQRWKVWSDQQYQQERRQESAYQNRKVTLLEHDQCRETSTDFEALLLNREDRMTRKKAAMVTVGQIRRFLTATQYRRLWLYGAMGLTEEEIAHLEDVSQQAVSKSLRSAMRRIRKYINRNL